MLHSFRIEAPGLAGAVVLVERPALREEEGDLESGFFAAVRDIRRHGRSGAGQLAMRLAAEPETEVVVLVRNPALVLDPGLAGRIAAARTRLAALAGEWSLAAAGGLTPGGGRVSALYSGASPHMPLDPEPAPLVDALGDLCIVDAGWLRDLAARGCALDDGALETILVVQGCLEGRLALYAPELVAGVHGPLRARDPQDLRRALQNRFGEILPGERIATLAGPVAIEAPPAWRSAMPAPAGAEGVLAEAVRQCVARHCDPLSISIVTRTRFDRPHLLRRLLSSITRARREGVRLEVILSSDAPRETCEAAFAALGDEFVNLDLRLRHNPAEGHSRVTNLIGGIRAATCDYVAIMDDDDYVDPLAFDQIEEALFLGARPLMVAGTETHDEEWVEAPSGGHVLVARARRAAYPASGWRRMFAGVNRLPVCALVMPRERLLDRLDAFTFRHDLSEDYALHLLVLTDPGLPRVVELPGTFGHVSMRRRDGHSMALEDRRPWVRDIALYLADLARTPAAAGPGKWALLAGRDTADAALEAKAVAELEAALAARDTELRLMRCEIESLRAAGPATPRAAREDAA